MIHVFLDAGRLCGQDHLSRLIAQVSKAEGKGACELRIRVEGQVSAAGRAMTPTVLVCPAHHRDPALLRAPRSRFHVGGALRVAEPYREHRERTANGRAVRTCRKVPRTPRTRVYEYAVAFALPVRGSEAMKIDRARARLAPRSTVRASILGRRGSLPMWLLFVALGVILGYGSERVLPSSSVLRGLVVFLSVVGGAAIGRALWSSEVASLGVSFGIGFAWSWAWRAAGER